MRVLVLPAVQVCFCLLHIISLTAEGYEVLREKEILTNIISIIMIIIISTTTEMTMIMVMMILLQPPLLLLLQLLL